MRNVIAATMTVGFLLAPAASQAQSRSTLQGFGGVSLDSGAGTFVSRSKYCARSAAS
ncbi:MAG: hypothetical protein HW394_1089, partial [Acidobacteria bacterium]|nr:hypothetical protein [Acidobacteriota bacterium]